jgi:uncharacterized membrane protein
MARASGLSTITATSSDTYSYPEHAFVFDTTTNTLTDITPNAFYAEAHGINSLGQVVGGMGPQTFVLQGFRLNAGTITMLTKPGSYGPATLINDAGNVAGYYNFITKSGNSATLGYGSISGAASTKLKVTNVNACDANKPYAMNSAGWIVGAEYASGSNPIESYAVIWTKSAQGWSAHDLTSLLNTLGILLDAAIAIDDSNNILA